MMPSEPEVSEHLQPTSAQSSTVTWQTHSILTWGKNSFTQIQKTEKAQSFCSVLKRETAQLELSQLSQFKAFLHTCRWKPTPLTSQKRGQKKHRWEKVLFVCFLPLRSDLLFSPTWQTPAVWPPLTSRTDASQQVGSTGPHRSQDASRRPENRQSRMTRGRKKTGRL